MTLEELKAIWDKAIADAKAKSDDEGLAAAVVAAEKAYNEKKAELDALETDDFDESKADAKTKAYLAKLRKENAAARTKNKELNSKFATSEEQKKNILRAAGLLDEEKPEEKLQAAEAAKNQLAFRNAVLESAVDHGIPKDKLKYYQFLISEATEELGEGEELSDEKLAAIVVECKKGVTKSASSTVIKKDKDGNPIPEPKPGDSGTMTLEKFLSMSMVEKSKLYTDSPAVYEEFYKLAKAKKKLV